MRWNAELIRAIFGDWRASEKTPVQIATEPGNTRGVQKNDDTGWDIQVSGKVFSESQHKGPKNQSAISYLPYINDILKKAVLLDSYTLDKPKSENSLMMHSFYAVADIGEGPTLMKLYVEEMYTPNSDGTLKRVYQLQNIENQQSEVRSSGKSPSSIKPTADIKTIADLHVVVKGLDKNFNPKEGMRKAQFDEKIDFNDPNVGLVSDDYVANNLSKRVAESLDIVARALGIRVRFADSVNDRPDSRAEGHYENREILIKKGAVNPLEIILGHEVCHHIQEMSPEAYDAFKKAASGDIDPSEIQSIIDRYKNDGVELSYDEALDEATANYAGKLVNDTKVLDKFINKHRADRNVLQRMCDAIGRLIEKLPIAEKLRAKDAQSRLLAALEATAQNKNTAVNSGVGRDLINPDLKSLLKSVRNNTFDSARGEVLVGTTSDFLVNYMGLNPLEVTMPANKVYAAMVSEETAKKEGTRYDPELNYHDLGEKLMLEALEAAENPIAAFVDENTIDKNTGKIKDRSNRIVLVTDKMKDGNNIVVVLEVNADGIVDSKRVTVNKDITLYDKNGVSSAIMRAINDKRLLHYDKKRSQNTPAGVPGANYPAAIQEVDFKKNIARFWDNVKWKKSGSPTAFEGDTAKGKTDMEIALERALKKKEGRDFIPPSDTLSDAEVSEALTDIDNEQNVPTNQQNDAPKTAAQSVTDFAEKYIRNPLRWAYQRTVSGQAPLERLSKGQRALNGDATVTAEDLVQQVRGAGGIVDAVLEDGLFNIDGTRMEMGGERAPSWREMTARIPRGKEADFNTYLQHRHNIDRVAQGTPLKTLS